MDELDERLARINSLKGHSQEEFQDDPFLRDIVERNLEIAAQCCIDISHRLILLENARKPANYYEAFLIMGEIGVLPADFARRIAPIAGLRNILTHEYLGIDWDHVYRNLENIDDLATFAGYVRQWHSKEP